MADRQHLIQLSKQLADDGKLIEAGWVGLRLTWIPAESSPIHIQELRMAFMAGAQHLFSSMLIVMDDDREPTARDMKRMELIAAELETFGKELELGARKPAGKA